MFTQSFVLPFLVPMLENAGAYVMLPRERDTQVNEVVVDNDSTWVVAQVIDVAGWEAKKTQVALNLGAGFKLLRKLQIGVTYQIPMGDSFELKDAGSLVTAKNKTWQASLAYIF
jgi:hypothetical protein